jgi:hypothetical protein
MLGQVGFDSVADEIVNLSEIARNGKKGPQSL